jgi:hypothetical protein
VRLVKRIREARRLEGSSRSMRGTVERHISSIFAELGHNEHPNTHRRVATVLVDLAPRPVEMPTARAQSGPSGLTSPGPASSVAACLPCPSTVI